MELASLPEVNSFEDAVSEVEARAAELDQLQRQVAAIQQRSAQVSAELNYYQGAAKALAPKDEETE